MSDEWQKEEEPFHNILVHGKKTFRRSTPHHTLVTRKRRTSDEWQKEEERNDGSSYRDYVQIIKTHARPKYNFLSSTFTQSPQLWHDSESQQISQKVSRLEENRVKKACWMGIHHHIILWIEGDDACRVLHFLAMEGWMMMMIIDEAWQGGTVVTGNGWGRGHELSVQSNLCLPAWWMMNDDEPGVIEVAVAGFAASSRQTDNLTLSILKITYCTYRRRSCQQHLQ